MIPELILTAVMALTCENHAVFVNQVAEARDAHQTKEVVTTRLVGALKSHPELGVTEQEIPELTLVINTVYAYPNKTGKQLATEYMETCLKHTGAEI